MLHKDPVNCLTLSPDGRRFAAAEAGGGRVLIGDLATGRRLHQLLDPAWRGPNVLGVSFSPDGRLVAGQKRWPELAARLRGLEEKELASPEQHISRGEPYARLGQLDRAAADYGRAFALALPLDTTAFQDALLCCCAGDAEGYRRARQHLAGQFARAGNADEVGHALRGLACAPKDDSARALNWLVLALAHHRLGEGESA